MLPRTKPERGIRAASPNHAFPSLVQQYGDVTVKAVTEVPGWDGRAVSETGDPDT